MPGQRYSGDMDCDFVSIRVRRLRTIQTSTPPSKQFTSKWASYKFGLQIATAFSRIAPLDSGGVHHFTVQPDGSVWECTLERQLGISPLATCWLGAQLLQHALPYSKSRHCLARERVPFPGKARGLGLFSTDFARHGDAPTSPIMPDSRRPHVMWRTRSTP